MKKLDHRLKQLLENAKEEFSNDNFIVAIPIFYAKKFIAYCAMKEFCWTFNGQTTTSLTQQETVLKNYGWI
ncbi:MAG: hypothetical protein MUW56_02930 [Chryseobacterium sp.]|uniref:hypothetical protein n=1 Tax=Chryseobacterium sp. TaxID=1871047 RepID=UPI0025C2BA9A|nr:hypothetical protein [Chryseobacterium sp.]MCJ7932600.1 hypothetical protein [Chryseobacterium sp.]